MSQISRPAVESPPAGSMAGKATMRNSTVQESRTATLNNTNGCCRAVSPDGREVVIPQELFAVFAEFMKTKKCPGSVTIDFRCDQIVEVKTLTKKRFSSKL